MLYEKQDLLKKAVERKLEKIISPSIKYTNKYQEIKPRLVNEYIKMIKNRSEYDYGQIVGNYYFVTLNKADSFANLHTNIMIELLKKECINSGSTIKCTSKKYHFDIESLQKERDNNKKILERKLKSTSRK